MLMKAVRLVLHQNSANYKKEETVDNKMTYPLPPLSTIIGAIHAACGYHEYKPMDISIQGRYSSMRKKAYTDYCFLNSVQDDRGILVKMRNESMLSNAFDKVASAQKNQGNSFRKGITINVHNQELLDEYRSLKDLGDRIDVYVKNEITPKLNEVKANKKMITDKTSDAYIEIEKVEKEIKELKKKADDYKKMQYTSLISKFRTLTTSLKFYEILDDITLILHIRADEDVLQDIVDNAYNLKSIGRSEDFVNVENVELVDLVDEIDDEIESNYAAYLDYDLLKDNRIYPYLRNARISGTKYYLNKDYRIEGKKRIFNKKKVLYTSRYVIDECTDNLLVDEYNGEKLIVNFL